MKRGGGKGVTGETKRFLFQDDVASRRIGVLMHAL